MNSHALIWIIVTLTIIVVMISLLLSYMNIERYWPEPYFMGEYTQNDRERYFDYMPLHSINRNLSFGKNFESTKKN